MNVCQKMTNVCQNLTNVGQNLANVGQNLANVRLTLLEVLTMIIFFYNGLCLYSYIKVIFLRNIRFMYKNILKS